MALQRGTHKYPTDSTFTANCSNGCGAWMGPARSGAPEGIDPHGACPKAKPFVARPSFTLPGLGWAVFDTAQGWCMRFPDGREDWPTPRERQIILAFRDYAERTQPGRTEPPQTSPSDAEK